ncbi:MAG TPA: hypothetical protein VFN10_02495 [Thermoanaerobaculia bacterium]|nr:hypothetical protein [Thermoanaerobaculia bacterium]
MEDIRTYRMDEDRDGRRVREEERRDVWWETQSDDDVPFHIPRD